MRKYQIFADGIAERLMLATSVMHSYVHQWSCQLHYNPRLKDGLGLTDGENVECLWSRMRHLIPVCRTSGVSRIRQLCCNVLRLTNRQHSRRVWLIDRQLRGIARELHSELGYWITRKLTKGAGEQKKDAQKTLSDCNLDADFLQKQWGVQKQVQLSTRSRESVAICILYTHQPSPF